MSVCESERKTDRQTEVLRDRRARASSNNNVNKMRLPALPKLRRRCSDPLNSAAISATQSNHKWMVLPVPVGKEGGGREERGVQRRGQICAAIFWEIIERRGLISNLSNLQKSHSTLPESSVCAAPNWQEDLSECVCFPASRGVF